MDIDNRNFIDVMKELSSSAGVELPKDNTENKKLSYTRQVTKPPVAKANTAEPVTPTPQQPTDESYNTLEPVFFFDDPFAQFEQPFSFDEPVQEGNLYDLLENVAQFYEHQLPNSQKAKLL